MNICIHTGLPCLPSCTEKHCAGFYIPLNEWPVEIVVCERCQGNGEIVTDWERYRHPREGDKGDEAVAECPDCFGTGYEGGAIGGDS